MLPSIVQRNSVRPFALAGHSRHHDLEKADERQLLVLASTAPVTWSCLILLPRDPRLSWSTSSEEDDQELPELEIGVAKASLLM